MGELPLLMVLLQELVKVVSPRKESIGHLLTLLLDLVACWGLGKIFYD